MNNAAGWACAAGILSPIIGSGISLWFMSWPNGGVHGGAFQLAVLVSWIVLPVLLFLLGALLSIHGLVQQKPKYGTTISLSANLVLLVLLAGYVLLDM